MTEAGRSAGMMVGGHRNEGRQPLLHAQGLAIGYPGRAVGHDISLQLHSGEILCLLGPNGSGKTTLFRTLLGLLPADAGSVIVAGKDLRNWSRRALAKRLAYVPQAQSSPFPFAVGEVVLMGRHAHLPILASPSRADREVAQQCLTDMGVGHLWSRRYTEISGGERQLVLIARALAQQPDAVIMDEPTASLDFGNQIRVLEYIRGLQGRGLGVLLCTHQPDHALQVADRVALFKRGRLHYTGPARKALSVPQLAWLYDLDEAVVSARLAGWPDHSLMG